MPKLFKLQTLCLAALLLVAAVAHAQEDPGPAHQKTDLIAPQDAVKQEAEEQPVAPTSAATEPKASTPSLLPNFINFGYIQFDHAIPAIRWNSMTHVGTAFVDFLADGSLQNPATFTSRNSDLRAGGAAQAAGTKVILVVRNDNFDEVVLASCLQSATARAALVNNVRNLVLNDSYCAGVNFDFEFSWDTTTRDGITAFMQAMRSALPNHELSVYTHATYSASRWNVAALEPTIDYMIYSTYDWATGNTAHAISDFDNCIPHLNSYFNAGLPPHKMVLAWASYSRRWAGTNVYNGVGNGTKNSQGFADALYDSTIRPATPTSTYVPGDEAEWYTYNTGGTNYTVTWDSPGSLEMKIRAALSMPPGGTGTTHRGKRLGGVGWWSLGWFSNTNPPTSFSPTSYNPIAGAVQSRTRTYPHVYQLAEEILSAPGDKRFIFEGFEGLNPRWTDPNESPDTVGDTDNDSARALVTKPAGGPQNSTKAVRLTYDFEAASGNRLFFRHEILNDEVNTGVVDIHSAVAHVDSTTAFIVPYHVAGNYSPRTIRMALLDGNRQIEVSPAVTLPTTAGWNELQWDLTNPAQIQAYDTNEPAFIDGNGVLNTAGNGARDIGFLGFIIEGGGAGAGQITFDELSYEHRNPGGKQYIINEFRYNASGQEFVEIHGPAGPFPSGMQLRFYNSATGTVASSVNLNGRSIPASGLFVVGDTGVANTTGSAGFVPSGWGAADNIPNIDPSAIQLYDTSNGCVYDSVTYEAMGGLDSLARKETQGVTAEGFGWLGEVGPGTNSAGQGYTTGRFPDGADTQVNQKDFSFMPPSPGASNGASVNVGSSFNFDSASPSVYQTYQSPSLVNPTTLDLPASPNGGNAWRVVDSTGGGVIGAIGDKSLGANEPLKITGQLYIPAGNAPAQAVAVGFCGTDGSTFFAANPDNSGYESGYWLIYENGTVNLSDGQPNHAGAFQFVHASNDNMDAAITSALGTNRTLAQLGVTAGTWTTFNLTVNPGAPTDKLIAQINNVDVYRGAIPVGGPTAGAFQVGFRETDGTVANNEGALVDDVRFVSLGPPAAPTSLGAIRSGSQITLTWTDNSHNEDGFLIERKRDDEMNFSTLATLGAETVEYVDSQNLVAGHQYCYRVTAFNGAGSSVVSNTACANMAAVVTPPVAPTGLNAISSGSQVLLSWTDNASNEDGFTLERKRDDELSFSAVATLGPDANSFGDNQGLLPARQYCYRVRAYNADGGSDYSNTACAMTANQPQDELIGEVENPGTPGDLFGYSVAKVAIGKQVAFVVGAPGADSPDGNETGRVYVFYPPSTTPALTIENPEPSPVYGQNYFGHSVSGVGSSILVGAPGPETAYGDGGRVFMFNGLTGELQRTLTSPAPVAGERFGHSVSGMGKTDVVVGAPAPATGPGKAYLFSLKTGASLSLQNSAPSATDNFGYAVAGGKGKLAVVGLDGTCSRGRIDVLTKKGAPFTGMAEAFSVADANGKFLVGAPLHLDCGGTKLGWAYLLAGKIPSIFFANPNATTEDGFGYAVAGGKKFVGIGAALYDEVGASDAGRVYLYRVKSSLAVNTFLNPSPQAGSRFGHSLALAENIKLPTRQKMSIMAVGAPYTNVNGTESGAVYFFQVPLK